MSGGGSSGKVAFPTHMEDIHKDWLDYNGSPSAIGTTLVDAMNIALGAGGNPWFGVTITDPSTDLAEVKTRYDSFESDVDGLSHTTDWKSVVDEAVAQADKAGVLDDVDFSAVVTAARTASDATLKDAVDAALSMIDDEVLEDLVSKFEKRSSKQRNKSLNRFTSTMSDINAVNSSAFLFGMAMIEAEHLDRIGQFQSDIDFQLIQQGIETYSRFYLNDVKDRVRTEIINKNSREELIKQGAHLMANLLIRNINFKQATTELLSDIKRIDIVATQEYELADADVDYKDARWDFEVYQNAMHVLGGMGGPAGILPDKPSKVGSAVGGALSGSASGALAGAKIGAAGGPIGALGGAAIGAAAGIGSALL